jgi:hypothetical protein
MEGCGLYIVDIDLNTKRKYHHEYFDAAYIPITEGDKYITSRKSKWDGKGEFEGIPVSLILTGGACLICTAKSDNISLEEMLDKYEKIASQDKYCLYFKPDLEELKRL